MDDAQPGAVPAVATVAPARAAAALTAELARMEGMLYRDLDTTLLRAEEIERQAVELDDAELGQRARLLKADMWERRGGRTAQVTRTLWEVNRWAGENGRRPLVARSHFLLAQTFSTLGDLLAAMEHSVSAVEWLDDASPPRIRSFYLVKLADALARTGAIDAARERYAQAEQLAMSIGDAEMQIAALNNHAYTEYKCGWPERAWTAAQRLSAVAAATGQELDPSDLDTIGRIQVTIGRYAEAEQTTLASLERYHQGAYEESDMLAEILLTLAAARRGLGKIADAQASLDRSRELCDERQLGWVLVRVWREQAELYAAGGNFEQAYEAHKVFFTEFDQLHSAQREAQASARQAMFETAEARQEAARFREQARRDPLTGLHNRRYVDEQLPILIAEAAQDGTPLSIALVDLDHFKRINDLISHDVGDLVLITVGNLLTAAVSMVSGSGLVARMGGEEFLLVLPGMSLADAARELDVVRGTISAHPWSPVTGELPVTVSIGVTAVDAGERLTQAELLSDADRNLYAAKNAGRDRVVTQAGPETGRRRYR